MTTAKFIYDTSERCLDLYYITRFSAPDPFIYFETRGKRYMVMNDLEIDRAKKTATVDKVLSLTHYTKKTKKKNPTRFDILDTIFREFRIKKLIMPPNTPMELADNLRKLHYKVIAGATPFYPERLIKTRDEVNEITRAQRAVYKAMRLAETTLRASAIKNNYLYYKGKMLTSERLKELIAVELLRLGYIVQEGTIIACGNHAIDPHNFGTGPLRPHQAIIVDIFPRSLASLYYGDATRTFCRGKAPPELKRLYAAVKTGQEYALKNIRAGLNGRNIHERIIKLFESMGYKTGEKDGRQQGFFHSTGHGIGLELHEAPTRIGPVDYKLKAGMVTSTEPALYYKGIGGVRIEDLIYITKRGCKILGYYPKRLEIL